MDSKKHIFSRELARIAELTQQELRLFFAEKLVRAKQLDAVHHDTVTTLAEMVLRGGKRIRPYLCWLGYTLAGGLDEQKIIRVGAAVDILHNYLLNLDDMADRDTLRHGGPTLEIQFANTLFVGYSSKNREHYARSWSEIAGAILNTYFYELVRTSGFEPKNILEVIKIIDTTMLEECAVGWQIHLLQNHQRICDTDEARFEKGLRLVTARYTFVGPLLIGLACANSASKLTKKLEVYGEHVGTAFQIHDDILGLFGDSQETGKAVGNDVREGKKTLLMQYAYAHGTKAERKFIDRTMGSDLTDEQLEQMRDIVKTTHSLQYSQDKAQKHVDLGIEALQGIRTEKPELLQQLIELAQFVISRSK